MNSATPAAAESDAKRNNFDALRLIAAASVLFSHAFLVAEGSEANEPLIRLTGNQSILGLVGVFVFFAISGYLITQSWFSSPTPAIFALRRVLRIWPALILSSLVIGLVLGPLFTTLTLPDYVASPELLPYFRRTLTLGLIDEPLPGVVFPFGSRIVNGSLWTLRYEVMMYVMVLILGLAGGLKRWVALALLVLGIAAILNETRLDPLGDLGEWAWFVGLFAAGMAIYLWPERRRLIDWRLAALAALGLVVSVYLRQFIAFFPLFGGYLTLYFALHHSPALGQLRRLGDLSYGVYIYGWPVEQAVAQASGGQASWWEVFLASLAISLLLAWISWHAIERRAIRWGHGFGRRRTALTAA
jgi:peptidoglycan/LPS O-acetylase OafA/YrhL